MPASSGEPLRIKASDWNDVLSMVRNWKGISGSQPTAPSLPCLKACLRAQFSSVWRPVWGEAVSLYDTGFVLENPIEAKLPLDESWTPSEQESKLFSFVRPTYKLLSPLMNLGGQSGDLHEPFAICLDPRNLTFAISGLACVRVRFISKWHRFARRPILIPGDDDVVDGARLTGCLDSSGHGPAQIIGVIDSSYPQDLMRVPWPFMVDYEAPKVIWALIRW